MKCNFIDTQHLDDQKMSTCLAKSVSFTMQTRLLFCSPFKTHQIFFFFPVSTVSKLLTFDTVCTSELLSFYCGRWMWFSLTEQLIPMSFNFVLLCKVFLTIVFLVGSLDCEFVKLFSLAVRSLMLYTFGSSALLSTNKVESSLRYVLFVYCLLV